jgi:hypothetical protein
MFVLDGVPVVGTADDCGGRARESRGGRRRVERISAEKSFEELKDPSLANIHSVTKEQSTLDTGIEGRERRGQRTGKRTKQDRSEGQKRGGKDRQRTEEGEVVIGARENLLLKE